MNYNLGLWILGFAKDTVIENIDSYSGKRLERFQLQFISIE